MTYTATVTREGGWWLATVDGLPGAHTEAQTLARLDIYVREVIVLAADLPDEAMPDLEITYRFDLAPLAEAARSASRRRRLERAHKRVVAESTAIARELIEAGYSTRDAATVLGVTPGRISQIAPRTSRSGAERTAA